MSPMGSTLDPIIQKNDTITTNNRNNMLAPIPDRLVLDHQKDILPCDRRTMGPNIPLDTLLILPIEQVVTIATIVDILCIDHPFIHSTFCLPVWMHPVLAVHVLAKSQGKPLNALGPNI
jgi:hypothetical protein